MFPVQLYFLCKESIECFPGIASISKYNYSFLVTILMIPIITGTTNNFTFHIRWISTLRFLCSSSFSSSFCVLSVGKIHILFFNYYDWLICKTCLYPSAPKWCCYYYYYYYYFPSITFHVTVVLCYLLISPSKHQYVLRTFIFVCVI